MSSCPSTETRRPTAPANDQPPAPRDHVDARVQHRPCHSRIVDAPQRAQRGGLRGAARGIAITTLRAVVGGMPLDDVLAKREEINEALRGKLDDVTNRWGVKVSAVEIPP